MIDESSSARRRLGLRTVLVATLLSTRAFAQLPPALPAGADSLAALAPYLSQLVRLAAVDPTLAASMLPDAWIDSLVGGALAVEAETRSEANRPDPPQRWPVGPWASSASLVDTIDSVDPRSLAALYRASKPRIAKRCRARGVAFQDCEHAIRRTGSRLSDHAVLDRAVGKPTPALTPTQRELARLGPAVVSALRKRIHATGSALWGSAWLK